MRTKTRPRASAAGELVERALAREAAEELELLRALRRADKDLTVAQVHALHPTALTVVDRLVARGHVTRYDGCLFGLSDAGRRRLDLAPLSPPS